MKYISRLRIVTIPYPYETWSHPQLKDLLHETFFLKIKGYQAEYPNSVLPIDTTDFFGAHLLLCEEHNHHLKPIMGVKVTPQSRCIRHQVSFPGLGLVQAAQAQEHIQAVQNILEKCQNEKRDISYVSSWTIDPALRENRVVTKQLREYFEALYALHHFEENIHDVIVGGTPRFKTDILLGGLGHVPIIGKNNKPLPEIHVKHLFGESVIVMYLNKFSERAHEVAKKYESQWKNRIEISNDNLEKIKLAA